MTFKFNGLIWVVSILRLSSSTPNELAIRSTEYEIQTTWIDYIHRNIVKTEL